jgi:hypothetical protein
MMKMKRKSLVLYFKSNAIVMKKESSLLVFQFKFIVSPTTTESEGYEAYCRLELKVLGVERKF